jgi:hypothetical protein
VPAEGVVAVTSTKEGSTTYTALCEREGRWWVITVPELTSGGVTQARTLDEVPAVVADLVATMTGADKATVEVDVRAHARAGLGKRRRLRQLLGVR